MKALVLGATGHIGNAVVRELLSRGWQVSAVSRRKTRAPNLAGLDLTFISEDSGDPDRLQPWLAQQDLVVEASIPYLWAPSPSQSYRPALERAIWRLRRLLSILWRSQTRFAFISTFVTLPRYRRKLSTAIRRRLHPYFSFKRHVEDEVLSAAQSGLPAVIVNPTACLGPWDMKPQELSIPRLLLAGRLPVLPEHVVNVVDVRDVASGLLKAVGSQCWGKPIELSGHNLTSSQLSRQLCDLARVPIPRMVPAEMLIAPACLLEWSHRLLGRSPSGHLLALLLTCEHKWGGISSDSHFRGVVPMSLSTTLVDSIRWCKHLETLGIR